MSPSERAAADRFPFARLIITAQANSTAKPYDRRLVKGTDAAAIASDEFTVADIMMSGVLRTIRKSDLMDPFPRIKAYYERCFARPAWERALALYAERMGVSVDDIR